MWTEEELNDRLTAPSPALVGDMAKLDGDILVLGAGGKMGPSLARMAKRAADAAGTGRRVIAVSRFSDPVAAKQLSDHGIELIGGDLLKSGFLESLPDAPNVVYMAGRKFGTAGQEYLSWAMNCWLPVHVAEKYRKSRVVVFSSGNIYPMMPLSSGGASEDVPPCPVGDYGMSTLGRERMFEYASRQFGTDVLLYRLNYALDLRYGVLYDIARKIMAGEPVSVATPCFNCIWQGDAVEIALRSLRLAGHPAVKLNVTGPETVSVRYAAEELGRLLGKPVTFEGEPADRAYLNNSGLCVSAFGYPSVSVAEMIRWQADWILGGGRALDKPTHFEERKGNY